MNEQCQKLIMQLSRSTGGMRVLTALVEDLLACSCGGLDDKFAEYASRGPDGGPSLIAELRMAQCVSAAIGLPVQLQAGAESDLRVRLPCGVDLTIEVEHKSGSSAYGAVFHPEPDALTEYATSQVAWKQAAWQLARPFRPRRSTCSLGLAPRSTNHAGVGQIETSRKSGVVGLLMDPSVSSRAFQRGQPAQVERPGRVLRRDAGFRAAKKTSTALDRLAAFIVREYPDDARPRTSLSAWLAHGIQRKSKIAAGNPGRLGCLHLVGLVINEAFASDGYVLKNTFLGGLVAEGGGPTPMRHYRRVPSARRAVLVEARERGRGHLLDVMQYDPNVPTRDGRGRASCSTL